jgi:hypothetical protein
MRYDNCPQLKVQWGQMETCTWKRRLFSRAKDPTALPRWYKEQMGVDFVPSNYEELGWPQERGPTTSAPFPAETEYFGTAQKQSVMAEVAVLFANQESSNSAAFKTRLPEVRSKRFQRVRLRCDFIRENVGVHNGVSLPIRQVNRLDPIHMTA